MNTAPPTLDNFYSLMTIILSGLAGILIGVPAMAYMASSALPGSSFSYFIPPLFGLAGLRIGYLRRNNRAFFYVSFFAVLVLCSIVGFAFVEPGK